MIFEFLIFSQILQKTDFFTIVVIHGFFFDISLLRKKLKNPPDGPKHTIEMSIHPKSNCPSVLHLGCRGGGLGWGGNIF